MRVKLEQGVVNVHKFKEQLLQWTKHFKHIVWLDSNSYPEIKTQYQAILAVDAGKIFQTESKNAVEELKAYRQNNKDWLFGYFSFDIEEKSKGVQKREEQLCFPKVCFFHPQKIFFLKENSVEIHYDINKEQEIVQDWNDINKIEVKETSVNSLNLDIIPKLSRPHYLEKVKKIQSYIKEGQLAEVNFCQEFYANGEIDPLETFLQLNAISKAPFASYMRIEEKYAMCTSPERYLSHQDSVIISQPIKGTAKRKKKMWEDRKVREALESNEKEILENTMIAEMLVDELYLIAQEGSVRITELCKAYTFEQVHQLISTVECLLKPELNALDAIKATSPMGSMTGTPKEKSLEIIGELENFNRGLYSGSIGYIAPNDNFDFNVVIRTILYNAAKQYISFAAGGAITELSVPEVEYEESMLKVKAMEQILGKINNHYE